MIWKENLSTVLPFIFKLQNGKTAPETGSHVKPSQAPIVSFALVHKKQKVKKNPDMLSRCKSVVSDS